MSITEVFLPGWGFRSSIWQLYYPNKPNRKFIDLSDFNHNNENEVLFKLQQAIPNNSIIYAWSISCLWLLKLLQQQLIEVRKLYLFSPPLAFNLKNSDQQQCFVERYMSAPKSLAKKFIQLVAYPATDKNLYKLLQQHCQLNDQSRYLHYLNHLRWMFRFSLSDQKLIALLASVDYEIILGVEDAIIDSLAISRLLKLPAIQHCGHLTMMAIKKG